MKIGWIGLGSIGTAMVKRALAAGHEVKVYERGAGLGECQNAGATISPDYRAVAADADVLGLCVFSDAQLRATLLEEGALAAMRPGTVVVVHTTGSPAVSREIGARAPEGVAVIDATFSGGPMAAVAGQLALMVGGEARAIAVARPLLETYADRIHHIGPLGYGQTLKLLNNLLFAANLQNAIEILRVAEQLGLDTVDCARIIQDCSGASFASAQFQKAPVGVIQSGTRDYMAKDVSAALEAARDLGIDTAAFASTEAYFTPIA